MSEPRWSTAVQTSTAFTDEQTRRVHALRVAREVIEEKGQGTLGAAGATTIDHDWLITVAQWIVDGTYTGFSYPGPDEEVEE